MNKGLELIEACRLFDVTPEQIQIVIHPQSVVHSMVEYADGSVIARPGDSDPGAIALMRKLAEKSRSRWPETAEASVRVGLPAPKRKGT